MYPALLQGGYWQSSARAKRRCSSQSEAQKSAQGTLMTGGNASWSKIALRTGGGMMGARSTTVGPDAPRLKRATERRVPTVGPDAPRLTSASRTGGLQ
eukprot:2088758-Alexandrium_andersonii.AAC.1